MEKMRKLYFVPLTALILTACGDSEEMPVEQPEIPKVEIGPADEEEQNPDSEEEVTSVADLHDIDVFWSEFTKRVATNDRVGVQDLFKFPMKDVDWLVEDVEGGVMESAIFQAKYETLFDSTAVSQIPQINAADLRKLEAGYEILGVKFKNGYEFTVNYNYGETESSMIFFIDEFEEGFRVCYLTVAG